ncbi:MAG: hypothetical protein ACOCZS_01050, partial [Verrucomicrobiota bacterium]
GGPLEVVLEVEAPGTTVDIGFGRRRRVAFLARFYNSRQQAVDKKYILLEEGDDPVQKIVFSSEDAEAGVYQVRYTTIGRRRLKVSLATNPSSPFGIQPRRAWLTTTARNQLEEVFFYVPRNADSFKPKIKNGTGRIYHPKASNVLEFNEDDSPDIDIRRGGSIWRMKLDLVPARKSWFTQSGDFDAILCPDKETAAQLRSKRFHAADGTGFPHRFQVSMYEWIKNLKPDDIAIDSLPDVRELAEAFTDKPRNRHLFGPWGVFSYLPYLLQAQTLENPMGDAGTSLALAVAFSLDEPFNPFYKNRKILNRLLLSEFDRYLQLRQTDVLPGGGGMFGMQDAVGGDRTAFALAGRFVENDRLRNLWLTGARRYVERYALHRSSVENQSAHVPVNLYALYKGSGDEMYKKLAEDWMEDFLNEQLNPPLRAGYLMEGYGPDATYQGIATCMLAWYFHWSGDEEVKEALDKIYSLFNHTVVPEPGEDKNLGASNFCHRTPGSWVKRQYGGGTMCMAGELESAAVWHQDIKPDDSDYREQKSNWISKELRKFWYSATRKPVREPSSYRFFTRYRFFPDKIIEDAVLPVNESDNFIRNFDDQFIAVRRPAYYALVYLGRPDPDVERIRRHDTPDAVQRRTGGGLSMFWTPDFGSAVLSKNWHAEANHMIRADFGGDGEKVDWPDYYSLEHDYDEEAGILTTTSEMMELPIKITRRYRFEKEKMIHELKLEFKKNVQVKNLVEQIPIPVTDKLQNKKGDLSISFRRGGDWRQEEVGENVDAVRLTNRVTGGQVKLFFPEPVDIRVAPVNEGVKEEHRAGKQVAGQKLTALEIRLGERFRKGETVFLRYVL